MKAATGNMRAVACVLAAVVSIQTGAALAKQVFVLIGPTGTTALRILFAACILLPVFRPWQRRLSWEEAKLVLPYGAALGIMNCFFYLSISRIPLGIAIALEFTGPLTVALLASRRPLDIVWAICAIAGIICILPLGNLSNALDPIGILYAFIAGACWAGYILFGKRAGRGLQGGIAVSYGMMIAALIAVPVGLTTNGLALFNWQALPLALGVAALSSALPYSLEMFALKQLPAKTFGILMSLEPAVGALSGLIILKEYLTSLQWAAVALVIVASAGSVMSSREKPDLAEGGA
ncbi:MAG: EamA family transporter [Micavibrio sp.]|nr:EamA family transporter [Micavibrio sp.]